MHPSALSLLRSPETGDELALTGSVRDGDDVREGELWAGEHAYPIREGIPSFVSEAARADQTVRSFDEKWEKHRYYREHTRAFYTQWYLARYGFGDLDGLARFLQDKALILDAGTGAGRDAQNFRDCSRATVFGVDTAWAALAESARTAPTDDPSRAPVQLVHADVNRLPFADAFFDFINCDQVLHHTPDPKATLADLRRKLKPGGEITAYVYRKKAVVREFVDDYVRERIAGGTFEQALEVCEGITKLGRALSALHATIDVEDDIPVLGIKKGKLDVQRFVHWNLMKCFWNDEFDFFTNNVVNADWYHPIHCFRFDPDEFRAWFASGWEILFWDEQEAGISCRARKV